MPARLQRTCHLSEWKLFDSIDVWLSVKVQRIGHLNVIWNVAVTLWGTGDNCVKRKGCGRHLTFSPEIHVKGIVLHKCS